MNIWSKMMTALKGGVNEAGEAIVDSQALRILDQEVREASTELQGSKASLADLIARQKLAEEKAADLKKKIAEHEGYAIQALEKSDDSLAGDIAEKIALLEDALDQEKEAEKEFSSSATSLRETIRQTERNLKRLKQQVDTVKATENVQRAQAAIAERHSGSDSKLQTAMESLERIKDKQALNAAKMKAAGEMSKESIEGSLEARLHEAGISTSGHSAEEILAKLKAKAKK